MPRITTCPSQFLLLEVLASAVGLGPTHAPLANHERGATGSHVPYKSPDHARATFMPDTTWPVNRHPPDSSQDQSHALVLMSPVLFRHFISGLLAFAFVIHT